MAARPSATVTTIRVTAGPAVMASRMAAANTTPTTTAMGMSRSSPPTATAAAGIPYPAPAAPSSYTKKSSPAMACSFGS